MGELQERRDDRCESCRGERHPADDPRKGNSTGPIRNVVHVT